MIVDGEAFFLFDTKEPVTPASDNIWDEAWVVAMRPSAAKRYFEGVKPEKKSGEDKAE